MVVFTIFFSRIAKIPSDNVPYPIFSYSGLILWTYFSSAVVNSSNSLVGSSNLISKVYFPRLIIPLSSAISAAVDVVCSKKGFAIDDIVRADIIVHLKRDLMGWGVLQSLIDNAEVTDIHCYDFQNVVLQRGKMSENTGLHAIRIIRCFCWNTA